MKLIPITSMFPFTIYVCTYFITFNALLRNVKEGNSTSVITADRYKVNLSSSDPISKAASQPVSKAVTPRRNPAARKDGGLAARSYGRGIEIISSFKCFD